MALSKKTLALAKTLGLPITRTEEITLFEYGFNYSELKEKVEELLEQEDLNDIYIELEAKQSGYNGDDINGALTVTLKHDLTEAEVIAEAKVRRERAESRINSLAISLRRSQEELEALNNEKF